ncbi:unnamed protein product [Staurois parvus]|uniref:Uncharacterized protein n=1 Tax=Staurois parvus TaxID=386267 RepID=A0ABN9E435_9NEOB|nr:unnamed protein product [Staurois parvus]
MIPYCPGGPMSCQSAPATTYWIVHARAIKWLTLCRKCFTRGRGVCASL